MPHAVVAVRYGGPEAIDIIEIPAKDPGPGEVVVVVRAAALNPIDAKRAAGLRGGDPAALPLRLGFEAAGVVTGLGATDLVGADGVPISLGDEVVVFRVPGAQADELVVPAKDVLRKPPSLGFDVAAGVLLVGTTAAHALEVLRLREGETVLVHGVAGSVGRAVAQLALREGARVIGTAAPRHHDELRGLGVEPVAYGPGLLDRIRALGGEGVDAAVDTVGGEEATEVSLALVPIRARIVTIAHAQGIIDAGGVEIGSGDPAGDAIRDAARPELIRLAAAGELVIPVVARYPLADVREAYEFLAGGHAAGKVVLEP